MCCSTCSVSGIVALVFSDAGPTEIYTLSLHDALPIWQAWRQRIATQCPARFPCRSGRRAPRTAGGRGARSEEHTSELQSHSDLVCRLLLEKKKKDGKGGTDCRGVEVGGAAHRQL